MKKALLLVLITLLAVMLLVLTGCEKEAPVDKAAQKAEEQTGETADPKDKEVPEETLVEETVEELYEKNKGVKEDTE